MMPLPTCSAPARSCSAVVIGFAFMVGYYGLPFVFSLYLQQDRGLSPLATGVVFLPMMLIGARLDPVHRPAGRAARPPRRSSSTGLPLDGGRALALGGLPATAPVWVLGLLMILVGLGGPLVMPPTMAVLLDTSRPARRHRERRCSTPAARSAEPWPSPCSAGCSPTPTVLVRRSHQPAHRRRDHRRHHGRRGAAAHPSGVNQPQREGLPVSCPHLRRSCPDGSGPRQAVGCPVDTPHNRNSPTRRGRGFLDLDERDDQPPRPVPDSHARPRRVARRMRPRRRCQEDRCATLTRLRRRPRHAAHPNSRRSRVHG